MASVTNLKNGSTGSDVKKLQNALKAAGYDIGSTGADGVYGKNTAAAVKQYQKDHGLAVDGIAGKNTQSALYAGNIGANAGLLSAKIAAPGLVTQAVGGNKIDRVGGVDDGGVSDKVVTEKPKFEEPTTQTPGSEDNKTETGKDNNADKGSEADKGSGTDKGSNAQESFNYDEFTYDPYAPSDIVNQANSMLQEWMNQQPGAYESQWQAMIDEYMNKIMNREEFSYNFNEDALYQQYKDIYTQQGLMAMMDTMGQASAMTGGYGNTYAQTVGQQAYNQQLNQLNNIMPELYQMAFDRYTYEGQQMMNEYGMLMDREATDYNRYQNNLDNWYQKLQYLTDRYDTERGIDLDMYAQGRAEAWDEHVAGREEAWDEYLRDIENDETAAGLMAGVGDYDRLKDTYGLTDDEVKKLETAQTTTANSTTSVKNYDNGALTLTEVAKIQKALGFTGSDVDGKWGEKSKKAAGGMTAEEAWAALENGTLIKQAGFTGTTYDEAVAYMETMGVPSANASSVLTSTEWTRRKNTGYRDAAVQNYSSYQEYLTDYIAYAIEQYA